VPSIISHPAVPIAIGLALGSTVISRRLLLLGVVASILPDLDVVAFRLGIPYAHDLGHRGASHSIAFATLLGVLAALLAKHLHASRKTALLFVLMSAGSHGLLDMLTNGGLGVAIAWPFSDTRFFFPIQVIEVSPLSVRRFFSSAGLSVGLSELLWVWVPAATIGIGLHIGIRKARRSPT
jgi:inner membrane protein